MENVLPASVKTIYKEIREIQEDKIDGIQLILNDEDISDIQTIRCLLIAPNPESALNEEAGRLLLEDYEEYTRLAKVYTEIHAPKPENRAQLCAASEASNDAAKVEAPVLRDSNGQSSGRPVRAKPKKKMSTMKKMLMRL
ncbi:unnamed protein product [Mesocestoides corti]|uniref:Uncharacterized protein n=1 Tax=Mesocestoides corti TaxID=53468 RepID=A0A0R3UBY3_MESCO|nr:unnamed protein product [Mesocestoides corti]